MSEVKDASAGRPSSLTLGKLRFKQLIKEAANYKELKITPYGLKPILIFVVLGIVGAFDGGIFGIAAPEIIRELEITLGRLVQATSLTGFVLIFATLGLGYYADRHKRVPLVAIGTALGGVFSLFTARAYSLTPLALSRMGDSLGGSIRAIPSSSLIADYYPPTSRGKVFALFGVTGDAIRIATVLIVAYLVTKFGWRAPFTVSGSMMIAATLLAILGLKEPIRGYMERKATGASEEEALQPEEPVSFGEAFRTIWAIRTIRTFFLAAIPGNVGAYIVGIFFVQLLVANYSLDIRERAYIGVLITIVLLPFGFLSGGIIDVLLRYRPQRVLIYSGLLGLASSVFLLVEASAPPLPVLIGAEILFGIGFALLGPAGGVLRTNILPAHVRTQGGTLFVLAGIPANIIQFFALPEIFQRFGIQGTLRFAVPFFVLSNLIIMSAAGKFTRDMRSAEASQSASAEWRYARDSGQGKMLVCRDVDVAYDNVQVLFGVDFDVEEGQTIALLGTNGAGKSTLLRAISGTQEASSGAIVHDGRDITHMPPHEITQRGVIHMPGGRGVFPGLTVKANLELGGWMSSDKADAKARLEEVHRLFPILKERGSELAGLLSGGEQQMLSLAQALLSKPKLLMIDELSLGLSPAMVGQLIEVVRAINRQGTAIIIVEQSVNVALTVAERAIFMEKGEVKFIGKTEELLRRPDILRAVYVKGTGALTDGAPAGAMRSAREQRQFELAEARPVLQVRSISKSFGGIEALTDVSIDLREGEALGLIGPNGAGKTTLFDIICGFQLADQGQIIFDGNDISQLRPDERAKLRLVRRFQDAKLFPALTVYENLLVALEPKMEVRNMALTALQVPQVRQAERRIRLRADRLIELLDLGGYRDKFVRELSTGLRRITDLACVLAAEPKVLLLDEPSTGIAQAESEGLAPLLRRVRFETGCSMLIIEHDMPLISAVSDELVAMIQGKVLMRGQPAEVLNDERLIQAYLGTSEEAIKRSGALT